MRFAIVTAHKAIGMSFFVRKESCLVFLLRAEKCCKDEQALKKVFYQSIKKIWADLEKIYVNPSVVIAEE